jgi:Ca2+-binding RTX toxin-like protein
VITATSGNNTIMAGQGGETVTVGNGTNSIVADGYGNVITTGNGTNTIAAGAGNATVDTGSGNDTVQLNGWGNLVLGGGGHDVISGGAGNTYRVTHLGSTGGMDIQDFSANNGNLLDVHQALLTAGYTGGNNLGSFLQVQNTGTDTLVKIVSGGSSYQVADLHNTGNVTLTTLLNHHSIAA